MNMKIIITVLMGVLGLVQYQLWFSDGGVLSAYALENTITEARDHEQVLIQHNRILLSEIDALKNGAEAIESHARYDLGMVKQGEVFYRISLLQKPC